MSQQVINNKKKGNFMSRMLGNDEVSVFIPLLFVIVITTLLRFIITGRFDYLTADNFSSMFVQIPFIAVTALGVSFVLMTGCVDISTGRVAGFGGILMAMLIFEKNWGTLPAIIAALVACALIGLCNGLLVVKLGVPDFVATMATLYVVGGARYLFIHGYELNLQNVESFTLDDVFKTRFLGMPPQFWIMLVLFAIVYVIIKKTLWGRRLLACGDNREVAMLAGINVPKMRIEAYVVCAILSCVAGLMQTLDVGYGRPEFGDGWEFRAIAGCVVGGVSLSGGKGSPLGVLIGVTLVFVAENAIIFLGMPDTMRIAVRGFLMAGAVLFDLYRQSRKVPA